MLEKNIKLLSVNYWMELQVGIKALFKNMTTSHDFVGKDP